MLNAKTTADRPDTKAEAVYHEIPVPKVGSHRSRYGKEAYTSFIDHLPLESLPKCCLGET
ncbi:hypothetical protein C5167_008277 [Papaver somniferum]|uniref:Uncharacterized protein n=1 Tax=Papaver somniferum TaxID=3469 RepID=A0A4Y7JV51_PAPSO|nr:hypothetical protein C5167_008277 [Papaver somniferum]